ncbi:MAG TPA: pectin acetylesterase-family hydrolase [Aggregatilineales bacterium]|nr:hypothetical protein [Anaerolineales bacterium]HRE48798.1 pectin acetylesterase-family hydrolase [Aggregatilineales bacterium]
MAKRWIVLFILVVLTFPAALTTAQPSTPPPWQRITPGGETICADGSSYSYFYRPGTNDNLVIFFAGGGACWDEGMCATESGMYRPNVPADLPDRYRDGMFTDRPENPFQGDQIILLSYCTGDLHIGNSDHTYEQGSSRITIHHRGFVNAQTALAQIYERFPTPSRVFIAGGSAGSLGAIVHAKGILEHYDGVPAYHLGDSGVGVVAVGWTGFDVWGTVEVLHEWLPELENTPPSDQTVNILYKAVAARFPAVTFAQFTTVNDGVQSFFLALTGESGWQEAMQQMLNDLQQSVPNFRAFINGGSGHTILTRPEFYTYQTAGIPFRDWLADLVSGIPVKSLHCTNCAVAELLN